MWCPRTNSLKDIWEESWNEELYLLSSSPRYSWARNYFAAPSGPSWSRHVAIGSHKQCQTRLPFLKLTYKLTSKRRPCRRFGQVSKQMVLSTCTRTTNMRTQTITCEISTQSVWRWARDKRYVCSINKKTLNVKESHIPCARIRVWFLEHGMTFTGWIKHDATHVHVYTYMYTHTHELCCISIDRECNTVRH